MRSVGDERRVGLEGWEAMEAVFANGYTIHGEKLLLLKAHEDLI